MKASLANFAAEPITPRGMAAFAYGTFTRLWVTQLVVGLLAGISVVWFFDDGCVPAIGKALGNLTGSGAIVSGELVWHGDSPKVLAEERFLALDVDLNHSRQVHCTSDVQVEFGRDSIRVFILPGCVDFDYPYNPPGQTIPVSREDLEPLWGAWLPEIQALVLAGTWFGLVLWWNVAATVYCLPVWILGLVTFRSMGITHSWRLAGASQLPGGLLLALAFFLYDFGVLDMVQFGFVLAAQFLLGWLYLFISLFFLPSRGSKATAKNPFVAAK